MKKVTVNLYTVDELSADIRQKVIDKHRYINVDYDRWYDFIEDKWLKELESLGYDDIKIYFSGFGSQGDGACFIANIDIEKWVAVHKKKSEFAALLKWQKEYGDVTACIIHNHHYYFASSTSVSVGENNWSAPENIQQQFEKLEEYIKKEREALGNRIYDELEEAYFDLTADESVLETLQINDYEFFEDGRRF